MKFKQFLMKSEIQDLKKELKESDTSNVFKKWFGKSKVVDKSGKPLVVYHGTPNSNYTKFKSLSHFTANKDYAKEYEHPSSSGGSTKKTLDNPKTIAVYLSMQNPFDTRQSKHKKIFNDELYKKWCGSPLSDKSGLPDWTDLDNIADWIDEEDQPYDGILIDEGGSPDKGHFGFSYVILKPNQVKSVDNTEFSNSDDYMK